MEKITYKKIQENMIKNVNKYCNSTGKWTDIFLKEQQKIMLDMLKEVHKICEKNNIVYYLDVGSLLGAVRHKGFIPWDDDIDISMFREDYNRFLKIASKELPPYLFLQTQETDPGYVNRGCPCKIRYNGTIALEMGAKENAHNGIWIDIFPYDNLPINTEVLWAQKEVFENSCIIPMSPKERQNYLHKIMTFNLPNSEYFSYGIDSCFRGRYIFSHKDFKERIKLEFENYEFYAPKNYEIILTELYGNYMEIPKIHQTHIFLCKKLIKS